MPYISLDDRERLMIRGLEGAEPVVRKAGELNFLLTSVIVSFLAESEITYERINTAVGALECAKHELLRRICDPYESFKMTPETDVYTVNLRQLYEQHRQEQAERDIQARAEMARDSDEGTTNG